MRPFKPTYFDTLAQDFLKSSSGQHYALAFTPNELVKLHHIYTTFASAPDAVEGQIKDTFGDVYRETTHGTHSFVVAGAMFSQWIEDMLRWEAQSDQ
jgi:hypothetical protein